MTKEELNSTTDKIFNNLNEWSDIETSISGADLKTIACNIKDSYEYDMNKGLTIFSIKDDKKCAKFTFNKNGCATITLLNNSEKRENINLGKCETLINPQDRRVIIISIMNKELDAIIDVIKDKIEQEKR